jgi:hypothetical protein
VVHNECPSYELGKSLTGSMSSAASAMRQAKYQAGHVVPTGVFSRRSKEVQRAVQDAKDALKRVNIDLNDAFNGFWTSVRVTWERIPMSSCSNWANDLSRCKVEQT